MKSLIIIVLACLLASCKTGETATNKTAAQATILAIELNSGVNGGFTEKLNQVITTQETFNKAWEKAYANYMKKPRVPEVDFTKNVVLLVALGEQRSGGYGIKVDKVVSTKSNTTVTIMETKPGKNCNLTTALTYPYQFVQIEKTGKSITFISVEKIIDCDSE